MNIVEALQPLAEIWKRYLENGLDEERPDWLVSNVRQARPLSEIELFSGRGGKCLLTLQQCKDASDALAAVGKTATVPDNHPLDEAMREIECACIAAHRVHMRHAAVNVFSWENQDEDYRQIEREAMRAAISELFRLRSVPSSVIENIARLILQDRGDDENGNITYQDAITLAVETALSALSRAAEASPRPAGNFQSRVQPWMTACFGPEISADKLERNDRFIEESLELVQASGYTKDRAHALVDYTFDRPQGDINQEVGGVMVTLAAHCLAHGVNMHEAGETELKRIWTKVEQIRSKQAAKPRGSALPVDNAPRPAVPSEEELRELIAREYEKVGWPSAAAMIRDVKQVAVYNAPPVAPITAALSELARRMGGK